MILSVALRQACNDNDAEADCDDESCLYLDECGVCGGEGYLGCTDADACNYDANDWMTNLER